MDAGVSADTVFRVVAIVIYILYSSLVPRARLLAGLLETLDIPDEQA